MTPTETVAAFLEERTAEGTFTHVAHLYVAAHCARTHGAGALPVLRTLLKAFLARSGVETTRETGYHETLTRFWLETVAAFAEEHVALDLDALGPLLVEAFGDKLYTLRWYTRARIMSWEARRGWVPPDLDGTPRPAGEPP